MDNSNLDTLIKKLEKIKKNQSDANKRYYQKNKDKLIELKKNRYQEKKNDEKFIERNKTNYKTYYERNK